MMNDGERWTLSSFSDEHVSVQPTLLVVDEETGHPVNVIFEEKQFFMDVLIKPQFSSQG